MLTRWRSKILSTPDHDGYRPEIDGLRAIAVIAVLIFHISPSTMPGGFIGVDVFFVISGYLITGILLRGLQTGGFRFSDFYIRRARRIFPALVAVLATMLALGWYAFLADEFSQLVRHVAAGAGFVSNFLLLNEVGYFDAPGERKPLLHLWSLGVEEQFYLIWPFMLWMASRYKTSARPVIIGTLTFSLALCLFIAVTNSAAAFYLPFTRFGELMAGGLLAWMEINRRAPLHLNFPKQVARTSPVAGALLLAGCLFLYPRQLAYPGLVTLLPVAAAAALIAAPPSNPVMRILAHPVCVAVGLISYPLYLWHWPLITFVRITEVFPYDNLGRFFIVAISFAMATLTYVLVERPIRSRKPTRLLGLCLTATLMFVGGIGLAATAMQWQPRNNVPGMDLVLEATGDWSYPPKNFVRSEINGTQIATRKANSPEATLFIGDSMMEQYAPFIDSIISQRPNDTNIAIFATKGLCPPIPAMLPQGRAECRRWMETVGILMRQDRIKRFVVSAHWTYYFRGNDAGENANSLESFLRELAQLRPTTLVLSAPVGREFDPSNMFEGSRFGIIRYTEHLRTIPLDQVLARQELSRKLLKQAAERSGVSVIDPLQHLCANGECPIKTAGGKPVYKDIGHLRPYFVIENATYLTDSILRTPAVRP